MGECELFPTSVLTMRGPGTQSYMVPYAVRMHLLQTLSNWCGQKARTWCPNPLYFAVPSKGRQVSDFRASHCQIGGDVEAAHLCFSYC